MGQIIIKARALDWTEGNVGHVHVRLDGGTCKVDWGDGHTSGLAARGLEWVTADHVYPEGSRKSGDRFYIVISSCSENITGILASRGEMQVEDIDMSRCQSLTYFHASWQIDHFDLRTNPGIMKVELQGKACAIADFSNSRELRELSVECGDDSFTRLDLTGCDKLETLNCRLNNHLTRIAISNRSALKEVVYESTPLVGRCLEVLDRIVVRQNGGTVREVAGEFD
ncbi:MAG: hypothetical protein IAB80_02290 [Bacteroidetes bacterium]|uniref:Uncharacterized protein n=1 Tax=Candidatus Cryptobacteroides excrementipullorum TaxID=2840761 RepID=A0A9D9ITP9_9BACT|nr:hypothetical protein [Candidatus Cryptobacteroides excrementipullorum]